MYVLIFGVNQLVGKGWCHGDQWVDRCGDVVIFGVVCSVDLRCGSVGLEGGFASRLIFGVDRFVASY